MKKWVCNIITWFYLQPNQVIELKKQKEQRENRGKIVNMEENEDET